MTGSGPAGELVWPDVKARLAAVVSHVVAAELAHEQTAEAVAVTDQGEQTDKL